MGWIEWCIFQLALLREYTDEYTEFGMSQNS